LVLCSTILPLLFEIHKAKLVDKYGIVLVSSITDSPKRGKCNYTEKHAWRNAINEHENASRMA
jgi:hypothetical protein